VKRAALASFSVAATALVGAPAHAIVGGAPDATRPDVLVLLEEGSSFRCTATLVAPNLVVTARHCVGKSTGATQLCRAGSSDDGAQSLPVYAGNVSAAPMYVAATPSTTPLAHGSAIFDDGAATTCGHDLALIQLDKPISGIVPAKIRRTPLAKNDALTVMGFGWTDRAATINATERMKGSTTALALGPVVHTFRPYGDAAQAFQSVAVAAGELAVTGVTMTGDSGGPAFDADGALAALVARGYADPSYGPGTFTMVAAHLATIDDALAKSGNVVADAGADAAADAPAPSDAAAPTDGGVKGDDAAADRIGAPADPAGSEDASGCAASPRGRHGAGFTLAPIAFAMWMLRREKRRRRARGR